MIENGEERILRFFSPVEKLYIVNNQYIHQLVKVDEIVYGVITAMIDKLVDEFLGTDIQNHFIMVGTPHFIADCLRKMGFAKTHTAINHERIEGIGTWFFSNGLTSPSRYPIAVTFNKYFKSIYRI